MQPMQQSKFQSREKPVHNSRGCCIQVQTVRNASLLTSIREWSTKTLRVTLLACSPAGGRGITPPCIVLLLYGPLWLLSTYTPACTSTPHQISSCVSCCFHCSNCSQPFKDPDAVRPVRATVYIQPAWTDPDIHVFLVFPLLCCNCTQRRQPYVVLLYGLLLILPPYTPPAPKHHQLSRCRSAQSCRLHCTRHPTGDGPTGDSPQGPKSTVLALRLPAAGMSSRCASARER